MSHYFAASAFKGVPPEQLVSEITVYAQQHGVTCVELLSMPGSLNESSDATVYASVQGWTVVIWPSHFNIHDVRLCAAVTRKTGALALSVNVYEGAFWSLEVLRAGLLVDKFSPWGDYFAEDPEARAESRAEWRGQPESVAKALGVPSEAVRPYYRYVGDQVVGKAMPDDAFPLEDFWVFTDLWRRLGIAYPPDVDKFARVVRFGGNLGDKLPTWEGEMLEDGAA